jgi:Fic family protein
MLLDCTVTPCVDAVGAANVGIIGLEAAQDNRIAIVSNGIISYHFPPRASYHNRIKWDHIVSFPAAGIVSLSYQMGSYRIISRRGHRITIVSKGIISYHFPPWSSYHYRIKWDHIVSFPAVVIVSLSYQMGSYRIISRRGHRITIVSNGIISYQIAFKFTSFANMEVKVYDFRLKLNWELMGLVSQIDRFDAAWGTIEKKEGQGLRQLKSVATVRSVGASTRIEGSKMSNEEIEALLSNINVSKLEDRDEQEASGYYNTLNLIADGYDDIPISESSLKSLHNTLLKPSEKDAWHKGNYKQLSNAVEATSADGSKVIVFRTTEPGMRNLIEWYDLDEETHPLVRCALFAYEFVSIHPFQDGNGRLSRLLSTLLLLKHGYTWIQYVSFEHEIEDRKNEYYGALRRCQNERPEEDVTPWVIFFLDALKNIQEQLIQKLQTTGVESQLSPREKSVLMFISNHPGCRSGDVARRLGIPNPTVKRLISQLLEQNLIQKFGSGPGTNYALA